MYICEYIYSLFGLVCLRKNVKGGASEMILLVQKREDLSSIPRTYVKMPDIVAYICKDSARRQRGSWTCWALA